MAYGSTLEPNSRRWPLLALAYVIAWTVPGLITTVQLSISYGMRGDSPDLLLLLDVAMPGWYIWALLAPGIAWAAWRFPLTRKTWPWAVILHLGLNAVAAGAWGILAITVRRVFELPGPPTPRPCWSAPPARRF